MKRIKKNLGFTMLELIIAISLLGVVSIGTGAYISNSFKENRQVATDVQVQSSVTALMNKIEKTIKTANIPVFNTDEEIENDSFQINELKQGKSTPIEFTYRNNKVKVGGTEYPYIEEIKIIPYKNGGQITIVGEGNKYSLTSTFYSRNTVGVKSEGDGDGGNIGTTHLCACWDCNEMISDSLYCDNCTEEVCNTCGVCSNCDTLCDTCGNCSTHCTCEEEIYYCKCTDCDKTVTESGSYCGSCTEEVCGNCDVCANCATSWCSTCKNCDTHCKCNIKPVLAKNSSWWKKEPTDKTVITEINIVDSYDGACTEEPWNADEGNTGAIKCYINGTKLYIAGNGTGNIYANSDSSYMFSTWGNVQASTTFLNVKTINGLELLDTSDVTNMYSMFALCENIKTLNLTNFKTENVTDMRYMFSGCQAIIELDVSGFNTSNVTDMVGMFSNCQNITYLDVSNFKTENVTDMGSMFADCQNITYLDVSNFKTENVTDMSQMFRDCQTITSLDVSNWNTSNVENMEYMFGCCRSLTGLNVTNWNTAKVTDMRCMFTVSGVTELDLSKWDTSNVTSMSGMFQSCGQLINLDLSNFDTSKVTYVYADGIQDGIGGMFNDTYRLKQITIGSKFKFTDGYKWCYLETPGKLIPGSDGNWYKNGITPLTASEVASDVRTEPTTYYAVKQEVLSVVPTLAPSDSWYSEDAVTARSTITQIDIVDSYDTTGKTITESWPAAVDEQGNITNDIMCYVEGTKVTIAGNGSETIKANKESSYLFSSFSNVTDINGLDMLYTTNVTGMARMFYDCDSLTSIDVSSFDTTNVTSMEAMFMNCYSLTSIDVSGFDTTNVTDMYGMFGHCRSLTSIDVSSFDTGKVTDMSYMFMECSSLTSLDLSSFDTIKLSSMSSMFDGMDALVEITLGPDFYYENSSNDLTDRTWYSEGVAYTATEMFTESRTTQKTYKVLDGDDGILVVPTLAAETNWWDGDPKKTATTAKNKITQINIVDSYNGAYTEGPWNADEGYTGSIKCYINGTTLYIAGNGAETIKANADSSGMFESFSKVTAINGLGMLDTSDVTDMSSMFSSCSVDSLDLSSFDTSNVIDMSSMFSSCIVDNLDLSSFDTRNVTDMRAMFSSCIVDNLDLSSFDTSKVTDMGAMFYKCSADSLDLSNFVTSNVIDMSYMFYEFNYGYIYSLDLSSFDTSKVTNMSHMFFGCRYLTSLDLSNFVTSSVTNMSWMFHNCEKLTSLDLSNFDTSKVTNMSAMFYACERLTSLDVSGFDTGSVTDMSMMFEHCSSLTSLDVSGFNTTNATNMESMFSFCKGLTSLDVSGFNTTKVTNMSWMFCGCDSLTSLDVSGFNTTNATDMSYMFYGCSNLTSLDVSGFDTGNVTDMGYMFDDCSSLTSLDVSGFDTGNVTDMSSMFEYCSNLTSLDVSCFNTSKVTNMSNMFYECKGLISLDVSGFNTSNVTNMGGMFYRCSGLTSLNISGFDTSNVTSMGGNQRFLSSINSGMFGECTSLTSLDVSNFDTSNVTDMGSMFDNCSSLTSLDVSGFDTGKVTDMSNMFGSCDNLTKLTLGPDFYYENSSNDLTDRTWYSEGVAYTATEMFTESRTTQKTYKVLDDDDDDDDGILVVPTLAAETNWWDGDPKKTATTAKSKITQINIVDSYNGAYTEGPWNADEGYTGSIKCYINGTTLYIAGNGAETIKANENSSSAFESFTSVITLNGLGMLDTSEVTNMSRMFTYCYGLTSIDLSSFDTTNVTSMSMMFYDTCLTSIDLSSFDTTNVTDMYGMFMKCENITSLDLSSFDTGKVTDMSYMFLDCSSLTSLDLSNFDTSKLSSMSSMFGGMDALVEITLGPDFYYENSSNDLTDRTWYSDGIVYTATEMFTESRTTQKTYIVLVKDDDDVPILAAKTNWWNGDLEKTSTTAKSNITQINIVDSYNGAYTEEPWNADEGYTGSIKCYINGTTLYIAGNGSGTIKANENSSSAFAGFTNVISITGLEMLDTSDVTSMFAMFYNCSSLTSLDVSGFNTGNVTNMCMMFSECSSLTSLDVSGFEISNVTDMNAMFAYCSSLTSINVSSLDTTNVTNMRHMFEECSSLTSLDLSSFDTGKVTAMYDMFKGCSSLTSIDVSSFDTGNVTDMHSMFSHCNSLTCLDLSSFDTGKVTNMSFIFNNCSSLTSLDISGFDTGNVRDMTGIVDDMDALIEITLGPDFYYENPTNDLTDRTWYSEGVVYTATEMFTESRTTQKTYIVLDDNVLVVPILAAETNWWDGDPEKTSTTAKSKITQINIVDSYNGAYTEGPWNADEGYTGSIKCYINGTTLYIAGNGAETIKANENSASAFKDFTNVITLNGLGMLDTSDVTSMGSMFNNCSSLTSLDLSSFDTTNVTSMGSMFYNCSSLASIDFSGFDTTNVTSMSCIFYNCSSLASIDFSGFDTTNVTSMSFIFYNCSSLTSLDISNFDTSKVTSMFAMLNNCSSLTSLDISNFDTSKVTNMTGMFNNCSSLTSLDISSFDTTNVTTMSDMFKNMYRLEQVKLGAEFSFKGNGSTSCILPTPISTYIPGADGQWYTADGTGYITTNIPSNVAATYYAVIVKLSYNSNGGSGAPSTQICTGTAASYTFKISSTKPVRPGWEFVGWSRNVNATSASYKSGGSITISKNTTLYAVWKVTLKYSANSGSGAPSPTSYTGPNDSHTFTITSEAPTRTGWTFMGWSTDSFAKRESYKPGSSITISKNTMLYAVWAITFTYDLNGGEWKDGSAANAYDEVIYEYDTYQTRKQSDGTILATAAMNQIVVYDKDTSNESNNYSRWYVYDSKNDGALIGLSESDFYRSESTTFVAYRSIKDTSICVVRFYCCETCKNLIPSTGGGRSFAISIGDENERDIELWPYYCATYKANPQAPFSKTNIANCKIRYPGNGHTYITLSKGVPENLDIYLYTK